MKRVMSVVLVICVLVGSVIWDAGGYFVFGAEARESGVLGETEETLDMENGTESLGEADVVDTEVQRDEDVSVPVEREEGVETETIVPQEEELVRTSEEDLQSGDFKYRVLDDGTIEITDYNGSATEVEIPEIIDGKSVTRIGDYAFHSCSSLSSIKIPEGVTRIGSSAFERCSSLSSIKIPESVTSIGSSAFERCSSLSSIKIPEGVTYIGSSAFERCSSLSSIKIPEGVTGISGGTFEGCSGLIKITVDAGNQYYESDEAGVLYNKGKTRLVCCPGGKTEISIPEGVTSIGSSAFSNCSSLSSIKIPEGVTSIGDDAFAGCISLSSIEIPEGLTSIEGGAFSNCSSLSSIKIPEGVTSIWDYTFSECSSLSSIKLPKGLTSIEGRLSENPE